MAYALMQGWPSVPAIGVDPPLAIGKWKRSLPIAIRHKPPAIFAIF